MNTSSPNPTNPNQGQPPDPLAVALSKLEPAPHGFDWNALMFAAGRASKTRALTFWRVIAGVCAVAAVGFALAYFARPEVVTERERVVFVERAPEKIAEPLAPPAVPAPVPEVQPVTKPAPDPIAKPQPESTSPAAPGVWTFEAPSEQGAAVRWFAMRNEVLTVGLSVLPDNGRKAPAPSGEK
jgi:hypothetical protein